MRKIIVVTHSYLFWLTYSKRVKWTARISIKPRIFQNVIGFGRNFRNFAPKIAFFETFKEGNFTGKS